MAAVDGVSEPDVRFCVTAESDGMTEAVQWSREHRVRTTEGRSVPSMRSAVSIESVAQVRGVPDPTRTEMSPQQARGLSVLQGEAIAARMQGFRAIEGRRSLVADARGMTRGGVGV